MLYFLQNVYLCIHFAFYLSLMLAKRGTRMNKEHCVEEQEKELIWEEEQGKFVEEKF